MKKKLQSTKGSFNTAIIIIVAVVVLAFAAIIYRVLRNRKWQKKTK